jgi:site-specific DNA-methyltransferase (cytosine-N4-specific)
MTGSGTTPVEAYLSGRKGIGFDIDPLALRISKVKVTPLDTSALTGQLNTMISNTTTSLLWNMDSLREELDDYFDTPTKAFVNEWFLPETQLELFALLKEIQKLEPGDIRTFFEVAFSSIYYQSQWRFPCT